MGCVSSKHFKRQARREGNWEKPTFIRKAYSNNELSFEEYHTHLVALRSSSYGLLKADIPSKGPESVKKNTVCVGAMDDIYYKLESMGSSAQKSWNEVGSILQTLNKPILGRSISSPVRRVANGEVQETIDVADMMQGLEEEASGSTSPAQDANSLVSIGTEPPRPPPPPPLPLARALSRRKHRKTGSCPEIVDFHTIEKLPGTLVGDMKSLSSHAAGSHRKRLALERLEENIKTLRQENPPFLTHGDRQTTQHLCKETTMVTRESTRTVVGDPARGSSNVSYSTSSGRLRLTLDMEFDGRLFTSTSFGQDGFSPVGSSARRSLPDCISEPGSPFFDPVLLASYERAMRDLRKEDWKVVLHDCDEMPQHTRFFKELDNMDEYSPVMKEVDQDENTAAHTQSYDPLEEFEMKCPPGGKETVVLYTTTLRGIRKTFEDCNHVRGVMQSFSIAMSERDVSMHMKFRHELKQLMGQQAVSVPRLFIKGRYIGGVDEIKSFHENGKLGDLVKGLPKEVASGVCDGCGGMRFVPCLECSGSCKVLDQDNAIMRCPECNENGLIQCPICS